MALPKLFVEIGANIDGFDRAMGDVSKRLLAIDRDASNALRGFERIGSRLEQVGTAMSIGVTAPLAAAGGAAIKFGTDFDLEMRKVVSLLGSDAKASFGTLSAQVLDVSRRMGVDAVGSAQALYEAISAGVPKENAATFLQIATTAAIAGVTDTKVAVDALTSAMNAYGPANLSAKEAADQMFQAVNLGKFTFEQLSGSLSIATPLAAQLGVSFAELLAPAATLTSQGFSINEAMTAVRSAMVALISPNKEMKELLRGLGVESGQALIQQRGLQGAFEAVSGAARGNVGAITDALGRVEALGAVLGTTGANADTARQQLDSIRNATQGVGAATAAYNTINESTSRQFTNLVSQLKITAIELGVALLPAVNNLLTASFPLVQALGSMVSAFTSLPTPIQTTIFAVTAAVAAIGPLVAGIGFFITGATGLIGALSSIGSVIAATAIPALTGFVATIGNVGYAVATGMTGALTAGEAALLSFATIIGSIVAVVGTAFVAYKIGEWAYGNIPGVSALGDAIGGLILKIPLLGSALTNWGIDTSNTLKNNLTLETAVRNLEAALAKKGITVERGNMTLQQYAAALGQAQMKSNDLGNASDAAKIEAYKKQIQDAQKNAQLYASAQSALGIKTRETGDAHRKAKADVADALPTIDGWSAAMKIVTQEHVNATNALNKLKADLLLGRVGVVDFDAAIKDLTTSMGSLGNGMADVSTIKAPAVTRALNDIQPPMQQLTISQESLSEAIVNTGAAYGDLGVKTDTVVPQMKSRWEGFGNEVSTIVTNFSQSIAKSLFDGDMSFGERFKKMATDLGTAVVSTFIQPAVSAISGFVSGALADLLGGQGLGGLLGRIGDIGSAFAGLFRSAGQGMLDLGARIPTSVPGIGGILGGGSQAASGAAPAAGAASGAASAASGILGTIGAIGSIGSFATGVINAFQNIGMGKDLGRIEESSRFTAIALIGPGGVIDTQRTFLPWLEIIGTYLYTVQQPWFVDVSIYLESIIAKLTALVERPVSVMTDTILMDIRGLIQWQNDYALERAATATATPGAGTPVYIMLDGRQVGAAMVGAAEARGAGI